MKIQVDTMGGRNQSQIDVGQETWDFTLPPKNSRYVEGAKVITLALI